METISLRNLIKSKEVVGVSHLRQNENGYPFVTILNRDKKAMNLYFGKNTAQKVIDNFELGTDLVANGFLKEAQVVQTDNEKGETRFKLSVSQGEYSSVSSLEDMFGLENETEFSLKLFREGFASKSIMSPAVNG